MTELKEVRKSVFPAESGVKSVFTTMLSGSTSVHTPGKRSPEVKSDAEKAYLQILISLSRRWAASIQHLQWQYHCECNSLNFQSVKQSDSFLEFLQFRPEHPSTSLF